MQDDLPLSDYSIDSGHVLHMVARPDTEHSPEHSPEPSAASADSNRNIRQNVQNATSEFGFPQFLSDPDGNSAAAQAAQLHRLSRNELEMLNQLMSGEIIEKIDVIILSLTPP